MTTLRTDTAGLRAAARRLRDEAAQQVGEASKRTARTEDEAVISFAFDTYGGPDAYRAVSGAWRGELGNLTAVLRQLADSLDTAADEYDRADAQSAARVGGAG